jgi:hypothetical protein
VGTGDGFARSHLRALLGFWFSLTWIHTTLLFMMHCFAIFSVQNRASSVGYMTFDHSVCVTGCLMIELKLPTLLNNSLPPDYPAVVFISLIMLSCISYDISCSTCQVL